MDIDLIANMLTLFTCRQKKIDSVYALFISYAYSACMVRLVIDCSFQTGQWLKTCCHMALMVHVVYTVLKPFAKICIYVEAELPEY
jgi:hypothetical protein